MVADELEGGLVGRHPGHRAHRLVRPYEEPHLVLETDLKGVSLHRCEVSPDRNRARGQAHRLLAEPRRGAGDPAGQAGGGGQAGRVKPVDGGETPGPVDDHSNPHALVFEGGDLREHAVLDHEGLGAPLNDPAVRVAGTVAVGGVER
jgi:hypothetical protein